MTQIENILLGLSANMLKNHPITIYRLVQLNWNTQWDAEKKVEELLTGKPAFNITVNFDHDWDPWIDEYHYNDPEDEYMDSNYNSLGWNSQLEMTFTEYKCKLPNPVISKSLKNVLTGSVSDV
jgi:hypothetical protein